MKFRTKNLKKYRIIVLKITDQGTHEHKKKSKRNCHFCQQAETDENDENKHVLFVQCYDF